MEEQWIIDAKQGGSDACRKIVQAHIGSVYAFFRAMGLDVVLAEDLTQESFIEVWKSLAQFRGISSLRGWILTICRRVAWRHFKKTKSQKAEIKVESVENETPCDPLTQDPLNQEELVLRNDRNEKIRTVISQLAPHYRVVVVLHYLEGLTYPEVAKVLDIAEGTAKSRINKALTLLRPTLQAMLGELS